MLGQENSPTIEPWVSERSCNKQIPVRILPPQAWGIIGSQCSLQRSLRVWRNCNQFRQIQFNNYYLEIKRLYRPAAARKAGALSHCSQVNSGSSRPKWP